MAVEISKEVYIQKGLSCHNCGEFGNWFTKIDTEWISEPIYICEQCAEIVARELS